MKRDDKGNEIGWDLAVVIRQVFVQMLEDRELSESKAAERVGIDQRTLNRIIKGESGMRLSTLERWCDAFETTPIRFFQSHPDLGSQRSGIRLARDKVYDRFRQNFTPGEQDKLLSLVESVRDLGLLEVAMANLQAIVDAAKIGARRALRRERRKNRAVEAITP